MDWLLDHLQFVLIVGVVLASWIKKRSDTRREEEETRRAIEKMANEVQSMPPKQQEWKRPERVAPVSPRQVVDPVPRPRPISGPPPLMARTISSPPPITKLVDNQEEVLQRQLDMQDRLVDAKKAKAAAKLEPSGGAQMTQMQAMGGEKAHDTVACPSLRSSLKHPHHTRRAFVLGEILGPPVALK